MTSLLRCCLIKDFLEYKRTKKRILFGFSLLSLCAIVLISTLLIPNFISRLVDQAAHTLTQSDTIIQTISTIFPSDLKANMGILASDIAIFYGAIVILSTYNLIVKEIQEGKWIFALNAGYHAQELILSKGFIYGVGAALPAVVFYHFYFAAGSLFLEMNYQYSAAITNAFLLAYVIFSITYITIILSAICKKNLTVAISMILTVSAAPDIFSLFSFGRFLPTHLLTYLYQSSYRVSELIIPILITVLLEVVLTFISIRHAQNIEISR